VIVSGTGSEINRKSLAFERRLGVVASVSDRGRRLNEVARFVGSGEGRSVGGAGRGAHS